jgi:hypothetical protein
MATIIKIINITLFKLYSIKKLNHSKYRKLTQKITIYLKNYNNFKKKRYLKLNY